MTSHPAKLVAALIGFAFLLAAPADAQKSNKNRQKVAASSPATAPGGVPAQGRPTGPNTVWFSTEYLGADPDPRIRHELGRDLTQHFGGAF